MENYSFEFTIAIFIHLKINRKLLGIRDVEDTLRQKQDIVHRRRALFYSRNHEMSPQLRNCDSTFDNFRLNSALTDWILRQVQH